MDAVRRRADPVGVRPFSFPRGWNTPGAEPYHFRWFAVQPGICCMPHAEGAEDAENRRGVTFFRRVLRPAASAA
jgi:hypothetical protein